MNDVSRTLADRLVISETCTCSECKVARDAAALLRRLAALTDAIGEHPTELRVQASMLDERGDHFIAAMLRRIADAVDGPT